LCPVPSGCSRLIPSICAEGVPKFGGAPPQQRIPQRLADDVPPAGPDTAHTGGRFVELQPHVPTRVATWGQRRALRAGPGRPMLGAPRRSSTLASVAVVA
jgi:hypothetical protein